MFIFIDTDKSGELSRDEVFKLVNNLSKGDILFKKLRLIILFFFLKIQFRESKEK